MAHIDPQLQHEVDRFRGDNRNLQALVVLNRSSVAGRKPDEVGTIVNDLVADVCAASQSKPARVVVFKNINSFAVEAPAKFLDSLLRRSQIGSATLNES
jgi:hypothetical protein